MRTIDIWRDPYGEGWNTTRARKVTFEPGLTVLVGCNGSGKTTLIHNIKSELDEEKIPVLSYDNLSEGRGSISSSIFEGNCELASTLFCSSEGECITINLSKFAGKLRNFIHNGYDQDRYSGVRRCFITEEAMEAEKKMWKSKKERWLLFDAIDSGLSIDNVLDLKGMFTAILEESRLLGIDTYIIVSANEYELVRESNCLDVTLGKFKTFKDYEEFRKFIIHTRDKKDKRLGYKEV